MNTVALQLLSKHDIGRIKASIGSFIRPKGSTAALFVFLVLASRLNPQACAST